MNIVKKIRDILRIQDNVEKRQKLDELDWILEERNFLESEALASASLLLEHVLEEEDDMVKESLMNALGNLSAFDVVCRTLNWDVLVAQLPSLSRRIDSLINALDILGLSKNKKYLSVLETYLEDSSPFLRSAAVEAIVGIRLANKMVGEQESKNPMEMARAMFDRIKQREESHANQSDKIQE